MKKLQFLLSFAVVSGLTLVLPALLMAGVRSMSENPNDYRPLTRQYEEEFKSLSEAEQAAIKREDRQNLTSFIRAERRIDERLFYFGIGIGYPLFIAGYILRSSSLGGGLMLGSLCSLVLAYYEQVGTWPDVDEDIVFGSLLVGFLMLFFIGLHFRKNMSKTSNQPPQTTATSGRF